MAHNVLSQTEKHYWTTFLHIIKKTWKTCVTYGTKKSPTVMEDLEISQ